MSQTNPHDGQLKVLPPTPAVGVAVTCARCGPFQLDHFADRRPSTLRYTAGVFERFEAGARFTPRPGAAGAESGYRGGNRPMRAFAGRFHPDIPNKLVVSFSSHVIREQLRKRPARSTLEQEYLDYLRVGKWFASRGELRI